MRNRKKRQVFYLLAIFVIFLIIGLIIYDDSISSISQMLDQFEALKKSDSRVLDEKIKTLEIRNYGTGDLFIDFAETY